MIRPKFGEAEWRLILETHEENMRRGHLTRIFPREVQLCVAQENRGCEKQQTDLFWYEDRLHEAEIRTLWICVRSVTHRYAVLVFLWYFLCVCGFYVTFVFDMHIGLQGSKHFLQTISKCVSCRAVASTVSSSLHLGATRNAQLKQFGARSSDIWNHNLWSIDSTSSRVEVSENGGTRNHPSH